MAKTKKNKKAKKAKKVSKRKPVRKSVSKKSDNNILIYGAVAAIVLAVIVFAMPSGNKNTNETKSKPVVTKQEPVVTKQEKVQEVKENKVSDIRKTKEVKPLNIPKKKKAINSPRFNEKEVQIRFAEIDYNSNKKISLNEYLYYFKDKAAGKKKFQSIDKNKDKSITYDEYLASKKK
jgi:hypothetical protein